MPPSCASDGCSTGMALAFPRRLPLARRVLPALLLPALARAEGGRVMRPDAAPLRGPGRAAGALVWAHQHYWDGPLPEPPAFLGRLLGRGWDLWRLDRPAQATTITPSLDPLETGAEVLAAGTARLRSEGYRRIEVVGES